jgi:hypothetical protein
MSNVKTADVIAFLKDRIVLIEETIATHEADKPDLTPPINGDLANQGKSIGGEVKIPGGSIGGEIDNPADIIKDTAKAVEDAAKSVGKAFKKLFHL